ncbi:hypothetical protein [Luteimicrobium subarcticum]|uniref:Aromatic ring-opening dioxygenase LigA n=1 Tax=Luteimicrobium subarcticum TaxID=620910 RepID=A0A2M8WV82_9MICO|nr:hypothetical protein [Luteimicrobium subarcticum]PJI94832.1 hypothetical protein CLV34_0680 [Luteimicrobium subarcticum]
MASSVTARPVRGVRGIGLFTIIVGIVFMAAGAVTYGMVTSQLRDENITVSDDADFLAGHRVQDPLTAYSQAEVINKHALEISGGKTYAELAQDDPKRDTVMNASFLRASLFTSVVAFGVAAFVFAMGFFFILFGIAFRRLGRGDVTVLGVVPADQVPTQTDPAPVAPAAVAPVATPVAPPVRESYQSVPGTTAGAAARAEATPVVAASEPVAPTAVSPAVPAADTPSAAPVQANPVVDRAVPVDDQVRPVDDPPVADDLPADEEVRGLQNRADGTTDDGTTDDGGTAPGRHTSL